MDQALQASTHIYRPNYQNLYHITNQALKLSTDIYRPNWDATIIIYVFIYLDQ